MEQVDSLNHKFTRTEVEFRTEVTISKAIRTDTGQTVVTEDSIDKIKAGLDMKKITGQETSGET